jgi:hypothetical protein
MYLDPPIADFVDRWWNKCRIDTDLFDQFVSAWIVLLTIARAAENCGSGKGDVVESDLVENLFCGAHGSVVAEMERHRENLLKLSNRRGTDHGDPMVDTRNSSRRELNKILARDIRNGVPFSMKHAQRLAGVLYCVRNNLFHGKKLYDDADDRELLALLNPILMAILAKLLSP